MSENTIFYFINSKIGIVEPGQFLRYEKFLIKYLPNSKYRKCLQANTKILI